MSTPSSNVNKLVDDLFSRPRQVAAAMSAAAAAPSQARGRASPLVDALFGSSDRTVMSTNSLRDNVLGALTHHGGAPGAAAGASASPARPTPSASVPKEAPGDMSQVGVTGKIKKRRTLLTRTAQEGVRGHPCGG
jgi:hypothetical protein